LTELDLWSLKNDDKIDFQTDFKIWHTLWQKINKHFYVFSQYQKRVVLKKVVITTVAMKEFSEL